MQAIYEAVLLIPDKPKQATTILERIQRSDPRFLEYLKTMALQLYSRFAPRNQQQQAEYEIICKHLLVIFSRFLLLSFKHKKNDIYLAVESYYEWIIELLLCSNISLHIKKSLVPSFEQVINSINYQPDRMTALVDCLMENSMLSSSSIFVYLESLLRSTIPQAKVIDSIKPTYQFLYYTAISHYESLVKFYKGSYMEGDVGQIVNNSIFLQKLKENEYILDQIYRLFKYIRQIFEKNSMSQSFFQFTNDFFFHPDIAKYLSSFLKIENDLLDSFQKPNAYGLKFITLTNLRNSYKNVINSQKSLCLAILKIILELSDKNFNLLCTEKLLMRELFNLSQLIINELLICSQEEVFSTLSVEAEFSVLVSSMLGLLAVIVQFKDLRSIFSSLNIQKLIRLTFFYAKTFEEELHLYESTPQDYIYFSQAITCNHDKQQKIDFGALEEFSVRQKSVQFIKTMNQKVEGYHSIIIDICCDIIILQNQQKTFNNHLDLNLLFMEKYSLSSDIFTCFNTESALSVFTILMQETWSKDQKHKKMYFLLTNIQINKLDDLELCRLYTCLSINCDAFVNIKGYTVFYHLIDHVFKLNSKQCSTTHAGYCFIERLLRKQTEDKDYDIFIQKVFDEFIALFSKTRCHYPFQVISATIKIPYVVSNFVCLSWINRALAVLDRRIASEMNKSQDDTFGYILTLYKGLIQSAEQKIVENRSYSYPSFSEECTDYHEQLIGFVQAQKFRYIQRMFGKKQLHEDDEEKAVKLSSIILEILVQQIPLSDQQVRLTLDFTLFLLLRSQDYGQIERVSFQLLYQLIHISVFTFDEKAHSSILQWMKKTYYLSEVCLNRICVILQQLYYYIDNNINQNQANFISFYSSIIELVEKKFLEYLFQYHNYVEALGEEMDADIKKINMLRIQFDPEIKAKTNPITIIRLYNTILLNPFFDIGIIRKIHQMLKKYNYEIVTPYDLTMQVLSLESLMKRSNHISVIECFRFTTELFGYNYNHPELKFKQDSQTQIEIAHLTSGLRTTLTLVDPYEAYSLLVNKYVFASQQARNFATRNNQIEITIMNYLNENSYLLNMVKKLSLIRSVNNRTRMIYKIRKTEE